MTDPPSAEPHATEDEWLVVRCQLGERPAFDELIQRWHPPLWKYVRRLTGDDEGAKEVVQDVWLRVLRSIGRLRDGSKLRAWLFGIARRALMDRLRAQYAAPAFSDMDVTEIVAAGSSQVRAADRTTSDPGARAWKEREMSVPILARIVVLALCGSSLLTAPTNAQVRDAREETLVAADGTSFLVTTGLVRVPDTRSQPRPGTIDLAVVRVRRTGASGAAAHVILAGGPGDSGVNLVLGLARQGGATLADLMNGDLVGIDQRGTGKSSSALTSSVLYALPLDRAGSPDLWLPIMERAGRAQTHQRMCKTA